MKLIKMEVPVFHVEGRERQVSSSVYGKVWSNMFNVGAVDPFNVTRPWIRHELERPGKR